MQAGQLDIDDQILLGDQVWTVTQRADFGDVTIVRDDGGCILVDHIGRHTDVDLAKEALADLDRRIVLAEIALKGTRRYSLFAAGSVEAGRKLRDLRADRERLAAKIRRQR